MNLKFYMVSESCFNFFGSANEQMASSLCPSLVLHIFIATEGFIFIAPISFLNTAIIHQVLCEVSRLRSIYAPSLQTCNK